MPTPDQYQGSYLPAKRSSDFPSTWRYGFERAVAVGPDTQQFTPVAVGASMAVSQVGGNLVVTTGTPVGETILRSTRSWNASLDLRYALQLSQRIVNQEFYVELVDVLGDGLALTVNGATSVTVVWPNNCPFTADNIGQAMYIGASTVASSGTGSNTRGTIAAVNGQAVTYTMPGGWTAGSGTCSVYGWNYCHVLYDGVTATSAKVDCQRNGYANGETVSTVATSAAPGANGVVILRDTSATFMDNVTTAVATVGAVDTLRWARINKIPIPYETPLFLQIRAVNTAVAASTTTLTIGFAGVEPFNLTSFNLAGLSPMAYNAPLPVVVNNTAGANFSLLAGTAVAAASPQGSTQKAQVTVAGGSESAVDYNAQAWTATSGNGATISDTNGMGAVCSFDVNLTFTAGSSLGFYVVVQSSPDNGTTWNDLWMSEAMTATGHLTIPPIYIPGRRRMRWVNVGGAATTATVTVTTTRMSLTPPYNARQWYDYTGSLINGSGLTSSAVFDVTGCEFITGIIAAGAITTTGATYALQLSADGLKFWDEVTGVVAVANKAVALKTTGSPVARFARISCTATGTGQTGQYVAILGR